jgi:hypothetical protein
LSIHAESSSRPRPRARFKLCSSDIDNAAQRLAVEKIHSVVEKTVTCITASENIKGSSKRSPPSTQHAFDTPPTPLASHITYATRHRINPQIKKNH